MSSECLSGMASAQRSEMEVQLLCGGFMFRVLTKYSQFFKQRIFSGDDLADKIQPRPFWPIWSTEFTVEPCSRCVIVPYH